MDATNTRKPVLLVVEDNEVLRQMLNVALQRQGFDVWQAANGREALDIYQHHRERIDLFLMDVQMDGLDGPETLTAIRECDPDVRCCFMTGDSGHYTDQDLLDCGAAFVLHKPFDLVPLTHLLRQLLNTPHSSRRRPAA